MDPGQFGAVGGRDRRADRAVALSYTDVVTQTACWEERSQVCDEIRLALAEVRRRTPSAEPAWGPRGTTPRLTVRGTAAGAPPPPPPPPAFMEHPTPLPHSSAHQVVYMVPHQALWNTPPPFPIAPHTGWSTRYPTSLYGTPLPPSPQHCTPVVLHGTPPAFMEHPSPLPHSTAHRVVYTVPHQPLWNNPPPFPTALHTGWSTRYPTSLYGTPLPPFPTTLHTRCTTRYPTSLYGTPLPPSPQHCTPSVLHGTPPAFMEHPSPLPDSTAHRVVYTVPHQPLWNTPPPLPHNTAHQVYYTVPHQPLWNTPPPFPTALHTKCTTRYPTSLFGTPLPPSPQHCTPSVLHGTPPAFLEHPSPLPDSTAHRVVYTVPHQPLWNTPPPLPHNTAHQVYYTVPHQPLWNTPPPFPTALHTKCTTRYPTSLYGTPLPPSPQHCTPRVLHGTPPAFMEHPSPPSPQHCTPGGLHGTPPAFMEHPSPPSPQHCTPGVLHGTPPAFMEHPSPLPHSTAHQVYYTVPHQPFWNTPPPFPTALHTRCTTRYPTSRYGTPLPPSPQHCTPGGLHGTLPAFMEHPSPLPHSTAHRVVYTVPHQPLWNTPLPFPTALHTGCTTRYPTSLYGTPLPPSPQHCTPGGLHGSPPAFMEHPSPLPHSTAHQVYYSVPHHPLSNTPPPFPTALHTGWSTRYPTSLYGTPHPPSPQHCTPGGLHGTPPAVMEHPTPLPHSTAHRVVYTVAHQPLWNTPPPFPTALHTRCTTRYPTSPYRTLLPPSPQHCRPGGLHRTPPAFMEHPTPLPHSTAHQVVYMVPHQPLWNTPPPFPTALHTGWSTRYPTSLYGTPLPPSP